MYKNIFEAERAITSLILKDNNCSGHFRYAYQPNTCKLDLITYNPVHKTHYGIHQREPQFVPYFVDANLPVFRS